MKSVKHSAYDTWPPVSSTPRLLSGDVESSASAYSVRRLRRKQLTVPKLQANFDRIISSCNEVQSSVQSAKRLLGKPAPLSLPESALEKKKNPLEFPKLRGPMTPTVATPREGTPALTFDSIVSEFTSQALSQTKRDFGDQKDSCGKALDLAEKKKRLAFIRMMSLDTRRRVPNELLAEVGPRKFDYEEFKQVYDSNAALGSMKPSKYIRRGLTTAIATKPTKPLRKGCSVTRNV